MGQDECVLKSNRMVAQLMGGLKAMLLAGCASILLHA